MKQREPETREAEQSKDERIDVRVCKHFANRNASRVSVPQEQISMFSKHQFPQSTRLLERKGRCHIKRSPLSILLHIDSRNVYPLWSGGSIPSSPATILDHPNVVDITFTMISIYLCGTSFFIDRCSSNSSFSFIPCTYPQA
jgi:hypothetical protein